MTKETIVEVKKEVKPRNKRVPFGVARSKLDVENLDPAYHYRWISDEPGRIAQALAGGYTFVTPEEVDRESSEENQIVILGGTQKDGAKLSLYLMKIPMEYHLEDKVNPHNAYLDKIDEAIRGGVADDGDKTGRYVPKTGINYKP